uniref:Uncharacterized protein n=1 Tax=Solanum tuberosum TaxID=4113 RepID=M1E0S1_SOLTU
MTIEDVWLFLEFETPRLYVLSAYLCTINHSKTMSSLLVIYMVLQRSDLRTQLFLLAYDGTHAYVSRIFYVSSGINRENETLLDSMHCNPFPFDPGVDFKCVECGSNTVCRLHDSSLVLLLDLMCLNEIASKPSTHELRRIDGLFTRMEDLGLILVANKVHMHGILLEEVNGRKWPTLPLWRLGEPLAHRHVYWAIVPRPPKDLVVPSQCREQDPSSNPLGGSPKGLGELDFARLLAISGHF